MGRVYGFHALQLWETWPLEGEFPPGTIHVGKRARHPARPEMELETPKTIMDDVTIPCAQAKSAYDVLMVDSGADTN